MPSTSLSPNIRLIARVNKSLSLGTLPSFSASFLSKNNNDESNYWCSRMLFSSASKADPKQRPIFVAATKQHVGKTTSSLAVLSGLKKRFDTVGFIKPVGQQHVKVETNDETKTSIRVDKDVVLIKEHFDLDHIDYKHMSPVIIPSGYTRKFVDGEISTIDQQREVENAFEYISSNSAVTLIEGTGHCAVGSIVGLNNAKVASILGADMILV